MSSLSVIKRVISNPDHTVEREHKMSKTSIPYESEPEESILSNLPASVPGKPKASPTTEEHIRSTLDAQLNISIKHTAPENAENIYTSISEGRVEPNAFVASQQQDQIPNVKQMDIPRQVSVDIISTQIKDFAANDAKLGSAKRPVSDPHERLEQDSERLSESLDQRLSSSQPHKDQWGWFEDVHEGETDGDDKEDIDNTAHSIIADLRQSPHSILENNGKKVDQGGTMMAVTAPTYVLEESRSSQKLWKHTAGNRPPQPVEERAFFERLWAQNFKQSQVDYQLPPDVLTAASPVALNPFADGNHFDTSSYVDCHSEMDAVSSIASKADRSGFYGGDSTKARNVDDFGPYDHHHTTVNKKVKEDGTDDELTVVVRGDNVFGTTVSKSFTRNAYQEKKVVTVSISIASYRVVESKNHGKYAQFLVIYCEGTFRDTVGVWKRYSDFKKLSNRVTTGQESCSSAFSGINPLAITEDLHDHEVLPNAVTSWNLLKKRQRWFRCLDAGYLSLKAFLLERFLHDILFESTTPDILRDFVSVGSAGKKD